VDHQCGAVGVKQLGDQPRGFADQAEFKLTFAVVADGEVG
jgi:hypothetical protein